MVARVALVGPGAIGCVVGTALVEAGHEVLFCARTAFAELVLRSGEAEIARLPARVITDAAEVVRCDWVLVCTKTHQTGAAAAWLEGAVGEGSRVAVLQNGVEHEANVAPYVRAGTPIVPVVVRSPARRTAPGVVVIDRRPSLTMPDTEPGRAFAALFDGTRVEATLTKDFVTDAWTKLCLNAANGAILALTGRNLDVMREPEVAALARAIIRECVAVGHAEGAKLDDALDDSLVAAMAASPDAESRDNSMSRDRAASRAMEWDARNGVIVRLGANHGIPTPVSSALVALLAAVRPA